jgi:hypothetical protein
VSKKISLANKLAKMEMNEFKNFLLNAIIFSAFMYIIWHIGLYFSPRKYSEAIWFLLEITTIGSYIGYRINVYITSRFFRLKTTDKTDAEPNFLDIAMLEIKLLYRFILMASLFIFVITLGGYVLTRYAWMSDYLISSFEFYEMLKYKLSILLLPVAYLAYRIVKKTKELLWDSNGAKNKYLGFADSILVTPILLTNTVLTVIYFSDIAGIDYVSRCYDHGDGSPYDATIVLFFLVFFVQSIRVFIALFRLIFVFSFYILLKSITTIFIQTIIIFSCTIFMPSHIVWHYYNYNSLDFRKITTNDFHNYLFNTRRF